MKSRPQLLEDIKRLIKRVRELERQLSQGPKVIKEVVPGPKEKIYVDRVVEVPVVSEVIKEVIKVVPGPERVIRVEGPERVVYRDNPKHIEMIKKLRGENAGND